jgi:hypothetical protein
MPDTPHLGYRLECHEARSAKEGRVPAELRNELSKNVPPTARESQIVTLNRQYTGSGWL